MHALRQHCGSFHWDLLQQQWLTEEERELQEKGKNSRVVADRAPSLSREKKMAKQPPSTLAPPGADDSNRLSVVFGDDAKLVAADAPPVESVISVQCAPKEWPLFNSPNLSSLRVTGCKEKGGTMVSSI